MWWKVAATISTFFAGLAFGFFYLRRQNVILGMYEEPKNEWVDEGAEEENLALSEKDSCVGVTERLKGNPMPFIGKFQGNSIEQVYVVDFGSTLLKFGPPAAFPAYVEPNIVGYPKGKLASLHWDNFLKGNAAVDYRKVITDFQLTRPVKRGEIQDFKASQFVWNEILDSGTSYYDMDRYNDLSLFMTASPKQRMRICEIMFEEHSLGKLLLQSQESLALADNQSWTGISVHLGGEYSSVVPFYMGCEIEGARKPFPLCGKSLTEIVSSKVSWDKERQQIGRMDDLTKFKISNAIKCSFACVPDEFGFFEDRMPKFLSDMPVVPMNTYDSIMDRQLLTSITNDEISKCGDVFFKGKGNLPEIILEVLDACDTGIQSSLLNNIVVHGGTADIPGMLPRLQTELEIMTSKNDWRFPVNVVLNERPQLAAWRGACNLTTLDSFSSMFVTSEMYHEVGSSICRSYFMA